MSDLPMQPKRIDKPAQSPAMSLAHGEYLDRSGGQGAGEKGIRIGDCEDHADGFSQWGCGLACRGAADPEFGAAYRKPEDECAIRRFEPVGLDGVKRSAIKCGCMGAIGDI